MSYTAKPFLPSVFFDAPCPHPSRNVFALTKFLPTAANPISTEHDSLLPLFQERLGVDHVFADGGRFPGEVGTGGVDLEQVRTVRVVPSDQQRHAKRSDTPAQPLTVRRYWGSKERIAKSFGLS